MSAMDVSSIASLATEMATQRTLQAAQIAMLKRAMDMQGAGALQLVQAVAQTANSPAHLGQNVNVFA